MQKKKRTGRSAEGERGAARRSPRDTSLRRRRGFDKL